MSPRLLMVLISTLALGGSPAGAQQPVPGDAPPAPVDTPPSPGDPVEPDPPSAPPAAPAPVAPAAPMPPASAPAAPAAPVKAETPPGAPVTPDAPAAPLFAPDAVVIVVNRANQTKAFTGSELRSIFLGSRRRWDDGTRIVPLARPMAGPASARMFDRVLDLTPTTYRRRWQKKQLAGQGMAPRTASTAAVLLRAAARDARVVGYLLGSEVPALDPETSAVRFIAVEE